MTKYVWIRVACLSAMLLGVRAGTVSAAEYVLLIDPDSVMASNEGNYAGDTTKMTDGSGMNGNGYNADGSLLRWPYDYSPGHPSTWINDDQSYGADYQARALLVAAENGKIGWMTFDLGAPYELADIYFWNTENNASAGTSNFNLYVATSAVGIPSSWNQDYEFTGANGWTEFGDNDADRSTPRFIVPMATSLPQSYSTNINVSGTTARYIGLEVFGSWGNPTRFGLAEIAVIVVDTNAPTLQVDSTHDVGLSVDVNNPVTYTLTFSEDTDTYSVTTGDFSNADSSIAVDSITQTATNVFEVIVTPTSTGDLQLQVSSNVTDWAGNPIPADVLDAETITVGADSTAPQVVTIASHNDGAPVAISNSITYTVTFNEYMDAATVATGDFVNSAGSAAPVTVDSVTVGALSSIFTVVLTPTGVGDVLLRLSSGSVEDASSNPTTQNWDDAAAITVVDPGLVIYEPFGDNDTTLTGNTSGMGLANTWSGSGNYTNVANQTYGDLVTSSNGIGVYHGWSNIEEGIETSQEFTSLLANGGEMWFSMIYRMVDYNGNTAYARFAFGIGDDGFSANGDLGNSSAQAIGFGMGRVKLYAGLWETSNWGPNNLTAAPASIVGSDYGTIPLGTNILIVGRVQWGADDATDADTVTLYMPGVDMAMGSPVAQSSGITSQDSFNLVATHNGNNLTSVMDEIRVGATYGDVVPLPPPAGTMFKMR